MTEITFFVGWAALALVGNHMLGADLDFEEHMWAIATLISGVVGMAGTALYFS